ncbi:hypothetical protein H4F46_12755 [Pectobacterium brasiliense]|uniref:hypothetical protein n=1 Tax=Pectobacterium brasiliense TaxID=180957 RepID=UPI000A785BA6|nr:hypothetical protein [Pectobacterium brasiliense]MBN3115760.1 hypothetical protein [Pectobacterium brasiliense]MDY4334907.1 hypothetical protein [Pectobacterium brasiliense]WJM80237.1 hypothetical protein QTI90_18420 [Pectobacterium brasiliense]
MGRPTHFQPRYNKQADIFKRFGSDSILCVSANDTPALDTGKSDQQAKSLTVWE